MAKPPNPYRTVIDIDTTAFEEASVILGTSGFEQTVNEALREVGRRARLRRGAALIRTGAFAPLTPADGRPRALVVPPWSPGFGSRPTSR